MRAVFVNHYHPQARHVGAIRLRTFAEVMAGRGHRIVLLTDVLGADALGAAALGAESVARPEPAAVADALARHDWARPFHLACPALPMPLLARLRAGRLPRPARMALIARHYLVDGGVFPDWTRASRPFWPVLAETFRPQVTWGTFGNTDAWLIAQGVARASGCRWVMDIKDGFETFVPRPLRSLVGRRFRDAAHVTGLSEQAVSTPRFGGPRTVIRSGLDPALIDRPASVTAPFRLMLTGGVYGTAGLDAILDGLAQALEQRPEAERSGLVFTYAGGDHAQVAARIGRLGNLCRTDVRGFIPQDQLFQLQREAVVNLYAKVTEIDWFHHKVLELAAAGRPIACLPGENAETRAFVEELGGRLYSCDTVEELTSIVLGMLNERTAPDINVAALRRLTWQAQADRLEAVFEGVIEGCGT